MNNVLTYHNDLNQVTLVGFTPVEISVFFALAKKVADTNENEVLFSVEEIRNLAGIKYERLSDVYQAIYKTLKKMQHISLLSGVVDQGEFESSVMFTNVKFSQSQDLLAVKVNPKVTWLLRDVAKNFTEIDLVKLNEIKSAYSKEVYRHLRQFKNTGRWYVSVEDFRRLLNIPESYNMMQITGKILNRHVLKELTPLFLNLKIKKIKKGRSIVALEFCFDTKTQTIDVKAKSKAQKEVVRVCYECGKPLYKKQNNTTGQFFLGHDSKDTKESGCKRTFSSEQHFDQLKELHDSKMQGMKHPIEDKEQTIQNSIIRNEMEELVNQNAEIFCYKKYEITNAALEFRESFGNEKGVEIYPYTKDGLESLKQSIQAYKETH